MKLRRSQYERILALDAIIRGGGGHSTRVMMARTLEVSVKTIQRDLDFLRNQLSAPLLFDAERQSFVYEHRNWKLSALSLSAGDAEMLQLARRALSQYGPSPLLAAFNGFLEHLGMDLGAADEGLAGRVSFRPETLSEVADAVWRSVMDGLRAHQSVTIRYQHAQSGKWAQYRVDPLHLVNRAGVWTLLAWNGRLNAVGHYALARMREAVLTRHVFTVPRSFDPEAELRRFVGDARGDARETLVRIRVDRALALRLQSRRWHERQEILPLGDGDVEYRLPTCAGGDDPYRAVREWVLRWGSSAEVLEPASLRERVALEAQRLVARYGRTRAHAMAPLG